MDRIKKTLDVLHEEYRDRRQRTKSFGSSLEIGSPSDVAHNVAVRKSSLFLSKSQHYRNTSSSQP